MTTLAQYYASLNYPAERWHIGAEHPRLEEHAIGRLRGMADARVLEIGYQAGGFAVPVILAMGDRPDFGYVGIDSLAYHSAVDGRVIARYLDGQGVTGRYEFLVGDARACLAQLEGRQFDLVLLDHHKPLYPREIRTLVRGGLVSPDGCILVHDVLEKARYVWTDCAAIVEAHGFAWSIADDVPGGLAVVTRSAVARRAGVSPRLALARASLRILFREARGFLRRRHAFV